MKKASILAISLVCIVLLSSGCAKVVQPSPTEEVLTTALIQTPAQTNTAQTTPVSSTVPNESEVIHGGLASYDADGTFEERLAGSFQESYCAVIAQVEGHELILESNDSYSDEFTFKLIKSVKGTMAETKFKAVSTPGRMPLEIGKKYLVFLGYFDSVYEEPGYALGGVMVELDEDDNVVEAYVDTMKHSPKSLTTLDRLASFATTQKADLSKNGKVIGRNYVKSDKFQDVVAGSNSIVRVKLPETLDTVPPDRDLADCIILETLKGPEYKELLVPFFKDSVKPGGEYILLLVTDPDSVMGMLSSKTQSVIPISDKKKVEEVKNALK